MTPTPTPTSFSRVQDSGERQDFGTGSVRDTREGKGRYDLLPVEAIRRLARHYENGAVKYGEHNWRKGQPTSRYIDSALRHCFAVLEGDTSEDHAAAVIWNMMSLIATREMIAGGSLPADLEDAYVVPVAPQEQSF